MDFLACSHNLVRRGIQDEIGYFQECWTWSRPPSCDGAKAGQKYLKGEGLCQVVVGARIETLHHIWHSVARREHQDPCLILAPTKPTRHLETIYSRKHHIEHNDIKFKRRGEFERGPSVNGKAHAMIFRFETLLQDSGHLPFIFNNEDTHSAQLPIPASQAENALKAIAPHAFRHTF